MSGSAANSDRSQAMAYFFDGAAAVFRVAGWPPRRAAAVLLVAALAATGVAPGRAETAPAAPKPANIDRNGVLILIRSSLLALDQANKTGNYTVLRDIGAPGFQVNSAAKLGEIFAKLRNDTIDLAGVAVIEPQLSLLPQIEADGRMHMTGFFPSVPNQVNFDLAYVPVSGQWRLFAISVGLGPSGPVAPPPPEPPKQPQISAAKPPSPFPAKLPGAVK